MIGAHLEGPFLSPVQRGAHDRLLLCSDGLSGMVADPGLQELLLVADGLPIGSLIFGRFGGGFVRHARVIADAIRDHYKPVGQGDEVLLAHEFGGGGECGLGGVDHLAALGCRRLGDADGVVIPRIAQDHCPFGVEALAGTVLAAFPEIAALGATGALIMPLEKADISKLLATGWKPPIPIKAKAADGVKMGYLEQEPLLDESRTVREVVEGAVQGTVNLLKEFEEINAKFAEPMDDEEMTKLIERNTTIPTSVAETFTTAVSGISHAAHRNVDWRLFFRIVIPGVIGGILGFSTLGMLFTSVGTGQPKKLEMMTARRDYLRAVRRRPWRSAIARARSSLASTL